MKINETIIILIFITIIVLSSFIFLESKSNFQKTLSQSFCGNNICEKNEEAYCLDCNLSCKSKFCDSRINIICDNCNVKETLIQELLDHQKIVYDCLSNYYSYHPSRLIYHTIKNTSNIKELCDKEDDCYINGGSFSERDGIMQEQIPGLINFGEFEVTSKEKVGFEIHELAHAFTYYGLGNVPSWLNEGISIYSESKLNCHEKQFRKDEIKENYELYNSKNITIPLEEYERTKKSNHVIGARYFGYLEEEYECSKKCISRILYSLYEYRQNYTKNDLRIEVINNKIIKQRSEDIIGESLTELFNLLEINYSQ